MGVSVLPRRLATVVVAAVAALGLCFGHPSPAAAAGGGYVRLAHLVPDTIACDMYLQLHSVTGNVVKYLPSIRYGTISDYVMVPAGTYAVAMRAPGAAPESLPVLSTSLTVVDGHSYTVARMGAPGDAQARIIEDDRTLPASGKAKLRVVQAAQRTLDISLTDGPVIAKGVAFTTATSYQGVDPGVRTVRVEPAGGRAITVPATMTAGSIYSLLVLEAPGGGVSAALLADAKRQGAVPSGGVATGAGGTAHREGSLVPTWTGVLLLLLLVAAIGLTAVRAPLARRVRP
jgi:Domain of unknown function (DUF4397)